jgi:ribonuclease BN (tRNA processing enzyme)
MKATIVGSGDAFGSGGRSHTCFRLDAGTRTVLVDFGAAAIVAWHRLGFDVNDIDAVIVSHLHGDHFGGLPFLLLEFQFEARRTRPLIVAGPPGLRTRLDQAVDVFFPNAIEVGWRFPLEVIEIAPGGSAVVAGMSVTSAEVNHPSGAPATAVRVSDGRRTFAYSGDTEWTDALLGIADGADLFVIECYAATRHVPGHIDWKTLQAKLPFLAAKRIAVTHMGPPARARADEIAAAGVQVLDDGAIIDL